MVRLRSAVLVLVCVGVLGACSLFPGSVESGESGESGESVAVPSNGSFLREGDPLGCDAGYLMRVDQGESFVLDGGGEVVLVAQFFQENFISPPFVEMGRLDSQGNSEEVVRDLEMGYSFLIQDSGVFTFLGITNESAPEAIYLCFEPEEGFTPSDFVVNNEHGVYEVAQ